jgi:hypothetical protein
LVWVSPLQPQEEVKSFFPPPLRSARVATQSAATTSSTDVNSHRMNRDVVEGYELFGEKEQLFEERA